MVALREDVLPSLCPICDMKHIVPAISYMVLSIGELLTHPTLLAKFWANLFWGVNVMSLIVLFANPITFNISTKNTVIKILPKKLYCDFK